MELGMTLIRLVKYILAAEVACIVLGSLANNATASMLLALYPLLGLLLNFLLGRVYGSINMIVFYLLLAVIVFFL